MSYREVDHASLAGDTLDDLFPGSGAVGVAWARYAAGATF